MSRPLVCDNPGCESTIAGDELEALDGKLPSGWVELVEWDEDGDAVELGEFCSRGCAAAYATLEAPE